MSRLDGWTALPSMRPTAAASGGTIATQRVCQDLKDILRIHGCETFKSTINRPNLFYEVSSFCSNVNNEMQANACSPGRD